jgi:hypothetical protein
VAAEHTIEPLLTEKEVARLLNVSVATIRRRRWARQSPEWIKFNGSVRYRPETVRRFIAEHERNVGRGDESDEAAHP